MQRSVIPAEGRETLVRLMQPTTSKLVRAESEMRSVELSEKSINLPWRELSVCHGGVLKVTSVSGNASYLSCILCIR